MLLVPGLVERNAVDGGDVGAGALDATDDVGLSRVGVANLAVRARRDTPIAEGLDHGASS